MFFVFLLFSLKNSEEDVVLNFVRVSGGGLRGGDSNFENKEILANHRPSPLFGTLILNMFLAVLAPERRGDI